MKRIDKNVAIERLHESRRVFMSMILGALTLLWTQAFQSYVNANLQGWNLLGINFVLFELVVVSCVIVVLTWFGFGKKEQPKAPS